jgi:hypothetical protein
VPTYRFEFSGNVEGGTVEVEFPNDEAARLDAIQAACEAMDAAFQQNEADWALRVYDEADTLVATVAFSEAMMRDGRPSSDNREEPNVMRSG